MTSRMAGIGAMVAGALLLTSEKLPAMPDGAREAGQSISSIASKTSKDPLQALKLKVGSLPELADSKVVGAVENPYHQGKYFILSDGPKASIHIWDAKKESLTKADLTLADGLTDPSNFHIRTNHDGIYITRINSGPLVISKREDGKHVVLGTDKSTLLNKSGDLVETEDSFMGIKVERGVSQLPSGASLKHLPPQEPNAQLQYKAILKIGSTEHLIDGSVSELSVKRAKVNDSYLYLVKLASKAGEVTVLLDNDGKVVE